MQLNLIWCPTQDMGTAITFYQGALGASTQYASEHWTALNMGGWTLGLHLADENIRPGTYAHGWTPTLLCDDLDALAARVEAYGGSVYPDRHDTPRGTLLDFLDPDGNPLQAFKPH